MLTAIGTWVRLSFRVQRLELLLLGAGVAALTLFMLWSAQELSAISGAYPECDLVSGMTGCELPIQRFQEWTGLGYQVMNNMWFVPWLIGLVLGVPMVAREVEHGTAQLAWTLGRSRTRWLLGRVAFTALIVVVLMGFLAVASEMLAAALVPDSDLGRTFFLHDQRGFLLVTRGLVALAIGVLVGAVIGRQLQALLLAIIVAGLVYAGGTYALDRWNEAEGIEPPAVGPGLDGPLFVGSGIELTTGERVNWEELQRRGFNEVAFMGDGPIYASVQDFETGGEPIGREYMLVIPGERYPEIMARTSAATGGLALLVFFGAAAVVHQRRPV